MVVSQGRLPDLAQAWKGCFAGHSHNLVFRFETAMEQSEWYWALHHFQGSAVLVWPVDLVMGQFGESFGIVQPRDCATPRLVPVLSFDHIIAFTFS